MKQFLFVMLVCLTTVQVNNEVCRLICRNDSYDTGIYLKAQSACLCGVMKKYTDLEEKPVKVPHKFKEKTKTYWDYEY